MSALSYGKRMLQVSLQDLGLLKRKKRISPDEDAKYYCTKAVVDKDGFKLKFISDYKGFGVFSTTHFNAGDFLLQYCGERISAEDGRRRLNKIGTENKCFFYEFRGEKLCIDAEESDRLCQMLNDAPDEDVNAVMKLKVFSGKEYLCLFAVKNIDPGEELLYNYGEKENLWWRNKVSYMSADKYAYDSDDSDPFGLDGDRYVPNSDENDSDSECNETAMIHMSDEDTRLSAVSDIIPNQNSFGDLVGSMGMQPRPVSNGEPVSVSHVTYEGKRKQNFDKEALELDSSTQQLQKQKKDEEQAKRDEQRLLQKSVCQDNTESDCVEAFLPIPCQDNTDCGEASLPIPCQDNTDCGEASLPIPCQDNTDCGEASLPIPCQDNTDCGEASLPIPCQDNTDCGEAFLPIPCQDNTDCGEAFLPIPCQDNTDCGEASLPIPCQDNTDCGEAFLPIPCQDNTDCGEASLPIPCQDNTDCGEASLPIPCQDNTDCGEASLPIPCQDNTDCGEAPLPIPCQDNTDCGEASLPIPCQDNTDCGEASLPIPNKGNKGSKKPDRFCVYCKETVKNGKLRRHITRNHAKIPEVENILKKGIPVEIQNQFFDEKRKEGISEYNLNLISENKDPALRERKPFFEDKLRTCSECKGYYSNKYFYKHKCKSSHPIAIKPTLLQKVNKTKMDSDKEFQDILNRFVGGQAGDLIRKTTEIQIIGYKHFNMRKHEEGKADEVRKVVMSDMRELARLYLTFKEITGEENAFEDMFKREHLQDLAEAIQKMVAKPDKTEKYGLKLLLDAIILRSIKTLMGYFSETMQDEKKKNLKVYLEAYKYKSSELFPQARQACVKQSIQKSRRPANLPCEMDLRKMQDHIQHNIEKIVNNYELSDYKYLRTLVVSRLTLFNARRGEESPRMLLSEWDAAEKNVWLPEEQIEKINDEAEKFLVGQYKLCYILGKGKKFVPVLIPNDIVPGIRLLVKERANYNIPESNNFVFATAKGTSHCSGWHALSEVCVAAGVKIPITATGMRHRLSTIYASLNMPAQQQKIFLEHMGHEQHINEDNYQCPRGVQAVKVMGKILKTVEQGSFATVPEDVATDVEQTSNSHKPMVKDQSNGTAQSDFKGLDVRVEMRSRKHDYDGGNASDEDEDPPMKQRRISVHWSDSDSEKIRTYFKDWIYERNDSNKGRLPSKQEILEFISKDNLESIEQLTLGEQYWKIRTKLFNDRKTIREKCRSKLTEITVTK